MASRFNPFKADGHWQAQGRGLAVRFAGERLCSIAQHVAAGSAAQVAAAGCTAQDAQLPAAAGQRNCGGMG